MKLICVLETSLWWSSFTLKTAHTARVSWKLPLFGLLSYSCREKQCSVELRAKPVWRVHSHLFAHVWRHLAHPGAVLHQAHVLINTRLSGRLKTRFSCSTEEDYFGRQQHPEKSRWGVHRPQSGGKLLDFSDLTTWLNKVFKSVYHWICIQAAEL